MRWNSVKKGFPPVNMMVLGYTNKGRMLITWIDAGTKDFDEQDIDDDEKYTHWMDLPKAPK